ncbi:hypothetical protein [Phenylobacterium sp.]|uniref:hypothetical protein n=1 Tax=Phenylobacterium sp. TaxID=1871053 RepID=UPI002720E60E|nr:hypothetical protein [Phenylobacterium sp.]MDO8381016.1 hypothetical protein [Phenylobacterium sp.]
MPDAAQGIISARPSALTQDFGRVGTWAYVIRRLRSKRLIDLETAKYLNRAFYNYFKYIYRVDPFDTNERIRHLNIRGAIQGYFNTLEKYVSYTSSNDIVAEDEIADTIRQLINIAESVSRIYFINNRVVIEEEYTFDPNASLEQKLAWLDAHAQRHPGQPISRHVVSLFPELNPRVANQEARPEPPTAAPASWASDKLAGETPPSFIKRHYDPWLGEGLTRADIRRLDPKLYEALANWLKRHSMPDDLDLPTLREQNDRWVDRVEQDGLAAMPSAPRDLARLGMAMSRRARRGKASPER